VAGDGTQLRFDPEALAKRVEWLGLQKQQVHRVSSSLLGPVDPSFRALSGRLKLTARRHKFNTDSLSFNPEPETRNPEPETPECETRNPECETRNPKLEKPEP